MSPVMLVGSICGALDDERRRNPAMGPAMLRARELVLQAVEQLAWQEVCDRTMDAARIDWAALRMDTPDMQRAEEPAYEVRHG